MGCQTILSTNTLWSVSSHPKPPSYNAGDKPNIISLLKRCSKLEKSTTDAFGCRCFMSTQQFHATLPVCFKLLVAQQAHTHHTGSCDLLTWEVLITSEVDGSPLSRSLSDTIKRFQPSNTGLAEIVAGVEPWCSATGVRRQPRNPLAHYTALSVKTRKSHWTSPSTLPHRLEWVLMHPPWATLLGRGGGRRRGSAAERASEGETGGQREERRRKAGWGNKWSVRRWWPFS